MTDLDDLEAVARAAVLAGGAELRERYRDGDAAGEYGATDVKAAADEAAEARMLPVVRRAFPDHPVFAEEAGRFDGTGPYRWVIDPLDGTNDFTAGLPTFATSVAVVDLADGEPMLAAVRQPATGETYLARRNDGVAYDGERATADSDVALEASTVATIVGRDVPRDPDLSRRADEIRDGLAAEVKRTIDSWAPTVHSGLFARGRLQGLVQFHPDEEERAVTELFAEESGAAVRREGPLYVAAADEERLDALWAAVGGVR
ncbi:inositol monophosphatase family protein [Halorubrum cibi]|uniref:fructose-bisphosphatase n=1 Tax=Halorubrum cibi TaxID=413815 RepID=A0A521EZP2_9EURY|nr:inositol monophosphatase family protein [Halorubrum cibi]SMO89482.1 myo-inositol-1(or 4)-monophosphatase [Halorubrum cibi]